MIPAVQARSASIYHKVSIRNTLNVENSAPSSAQTDKHNENFYTKYLRKPQNTCMQIILIKWLKRKVFTSFCY